MKSLAIAYSQKRKKNLKSIGAPEAQSEDFVEDKPSTFKRDPKSIAQAIRNQMSPPVEPETDFLSDEGEDDLYNFMDTPDLEEPESDPIAKRHEMISQILGKLGTK